MLTLLLIASLSACSYAGPVEYSIEPDPEPSYDLVILEPDPVVWPEYSEADFFDLGFEATDWVAYFADEDQLSEQDYQTLIDVKFGPYLDC